jgi:hypothetical protein
MSQPSINESTIEAIKEYTDAIKKLVPIAQGDTGGSQVAAQVLLSAYDGENFQLNIVDLGRLDSESYQAALAVIRGRVELQDEPHKYMANGEDVFCKLWHQWHYLHVTNRGAISGG